MLIDWFTVGAQIVNFLILVALLKYFLYDRIVSAMDEREKRISSKMEEAESLKKETEEKAEHYRQKQAQLEEERRKTLEQARKEADQRREELLAQARHEVDSVKSRWYEALEREKNRFLNELRQTIGRQSVELLRKSLNDLADEDLEQRVIHVFIQRMENLSEDQLRDMQQSVRDGDGSLTVQSSFDLSEDAQEEISRSLRDAMGDNVTIDYEQTDDLISGIVVRARGRKMGWSLGGYLDQLEESVGRQVERTAQRQSSSDGGNERGETEE